MSNSGDNCAHCGKPKNRLYPGMSMYCLKCTWIVRHPLAAKAYDIIGLAIATGKVPSARGLVCVDCSEPATEYDHRDYTKPLEVDPVCRSCNHRRGPAHPYLCLDDYR